MMTEYFFDVRRNGVAIAAKLAIVVLLFTSLYTTMSFSESTQNAVDQSFRPEGDKNLYTITDTVLNPDEFEAFRQDRERIASLGAFYNALNNSGELTLASAFAQPVPIADFRGGDSFDASAGSEHVSGGVYRDPDTGRDTRDVLSMQMNEKAATFAGLAVEEGELPDWENVSYSRGTLPVLLGANYLGVYSLGEELEGQLYWQSFKLKVVGFLKPGSSMFYKDTINYFLDDVLVIPYPAVLDTPTAETLPFMGILTFAMINSDIYAPKSLSVDDVIEHLGVQGRLAGFEEYSLIDVPQYLVQYSLTRAIIVDNARLVQVHHVLLGIVAGGVLVAISAVLYRRRRQTLDVLWKIGVPKNRLSLSLLMMTLSEWMLFAMVFGLVYLTLPSSGSAAATDGLRAALLVLAGTEGGIAVFALRRHINRKQDPA